MGQPVRKAPAAAIFYLPVFGGTCIVLMWSDDMGSCSTMKLKYGQSAGEAHVTEC